MTPAAGLGPPSAPRADRPPQQPDSCELAPTLAPSSSSSWSPPEARQYNLRRKRPRTTYKMSSDRANWDQASTKKLLDLCINERNLLNFNKKGPTRLGWQHIYEGLDAAYGNRFDKKQVQNKLAGLRLKYNHWLQLQNQSGLGRDRNTGGISADDSFWEQPDGGDNSDDHNRGHPPQFLDELSTLFGRTPQDRGTLIWAGGVRERTPTLGSDDNQQDMSQDPVAASVAGPSSKRHSRDVEVDSPPKKRSASLEDYVRDIKDSIVKRLERPRLRPEQEEMDLVRQILKNDGIVEGSDLFYKALFLCKDACNRRVFTTMETPEGRVGWINFNWEHK